MFYFDFSAGFLLLALIAAFTFGTMNATELTFRENFLITGYRKMAFAVGAGVLFNIANLLMTASVASAGMSVAFILALGTATVVGVVWDFIAIPDANAMLMFGGAVLVLAAVVAMALAYSAYKEAIFLASKKAALQVDPRTKQGKRSPQRSGAAVGIVVGIFSGILFGFFPPLMNLATEGENGVSP